MTIVLVPGNPETDAIWDDLVPYLRGQHVVRLSPPGFGSAIPPGFNCSIDAYIATGWKANWKGWRNRSISWGMIGAGHMSCASQWIVRILYDP
jgi:hypothetical protein